jgi:hypothetical protein
MFSALIFLELNYNTKFNIYNSVLNLVYLFSYEPCTGAFSFGNHDKEMFATSQFKFVLEPLDS